MANKMTSEFGNYITLNGNCFKLRQHPTDFSLIGRSKALDSELCKSKEKISYNMTRVMAVGDKDTDPLMVEARKDSVAHHIYQVEGTNEEIIIDDRIILNLRYEGAGKLEEIIQEFKLIPVGRMGNAHVLRVTEASGRNPLKVANEIAEREDVAMCSPQVMLELVLHQQPVLFPEQWYLTADLISHADLLADADIQAPEAWEITSGSPDIVAAVIDDGFDLEHPAFSNTRIHPAHRDYMGQDTDPRSEADDYHGTPVASIAVGSHQGSAIRGIAPDCTFLPVRIGFGPFAPPIDILNVFKHVSQHADVVNCSFGTSPSSFDRMPSDFRAEITRLTETGGRRGKGLVMVFSAANDDAPTFLEKSKNINGVKFTRFTDTGAVISEIAAGNNVFSGYPMIDGVIVVGAMSSLKRKAGYSCWGTHLTVAAPSNNMHYIMSFVRPGSDPRRDLFVANYRGLGQVAAVNRPGHGDQFAPISDDPYTPDIRENLYTKKFGGTSGAAPVVTGVAGLMLSVNKNLTAAQVRQILMATADKELDQTLDLANDPNVQGLSGAFVNGRSLFFGSGKVNALEAVKRARALNGGNGGVEPPPGNRHGSASPGLSIPDKNPEGVVSYINLAAPGPVRNITVSVDITHSYRGDLQVTLISPAGFPAVLHRVYQGGAAQDLKQTYRPSDTQSLKALVDGGVEGGGRWTLHVSDLLFRDTGTLNSWSLDLRA